MRGKHKHSELFLFATSLRDSLTLFKKNDPLRMAGATAFFTTFALPPIIFILVQLFGLFVDRRIIGRGLITHVSNTLGKDGAGQVRQVIKSIRGFSDNWYVIVFGFLFLIFVATSLFSVIKNSLDQIWKITIKDRPGFLFALSIRARSMGIIIVAGILFFADMLFDSLEVMAGNNIEEIWPGSGIYSRTILSKIGSVIIIASWFILLFRFLADAKPTWKASIIGGVLTGTLFIAGRILLRILLVDSNIGELYGTSGSFVLILLFLFYSSFILYYGACFVAVYSEKKQWTILPNNKAYNYTIEEMKNVAGGI